MLWWYNVRTQSSIAGFEDGKDKNQGMLAASVNWKRQGNQLPLEPPEHNPDNTFIVG